MDGDAPYLPQEIFTNILKRLPVKSLIRFQCVSKDWKNLFKTPSFIAEHVRHSTQQKSVLLFNLGYKCNPEYLCLINRDMQVLEYQNPPSLVRSCTIGSSNGLLCLLYVSSFILWNPATREVLQVPKVPDCDGTCYVGFGFSQIVNDYKIVRVSISRLADDLVYLVQVFSASTRSWKEVEVGKLKGIMSFFGGGFSFDGSIFWFGFDCKRSWGKKLCLISFDVATESFALIPIPRSTLVTIESRLTTYENKLAMLSKTRVHSSFSINLWVMEECEDTSGEGWIWTKIYTSNPFPHRAHFSSTLTIWRNEIVGVNEGKTVLVLCNLHTNEFKMLALGKYSIGDLIWNYAESLVSVCDIHVEASSWGWQWIHVLFAWILLFSTVNILFFFGSNVNIL
ncbi:hypothetical protein QN277_009042 [Acacia crassicarpa]|uniref:F-box domain-containing protein n=1 Tax=Acacia crassicarpa TaxID=499986 RepID=A0AAE1M8U2_9FABA|nr:hypothetical protein QN277_009042 [Acacia crassicarpa]